MVLYTVIEVQASAKAAAGKDSRLATFLVRSQAKQIDDQDSARTALLPQVDEAEDARDNANDKYFQACGDFLTDIKLAGGEALGSNVPAASGDCVRLDTVTAYYAQVLSGITMAKAAGNSLIAKTDFERKLTNLDIEHKLVETDFEDSAKNNRIANRKKNALMFAERRYDDLVKLDTASAQAPAPAVNNPAAAPEAAGAATLGSVAVTYNQLSSLPFFRALFELPSGVIVAFFTAIMGSIGAAVFSLLDDIQQRRLMKEGFIRDISWMWVSYASRPLLGAMAGFMVFFVISAGAAFLIQPGTINATDAVNALSPPALASLGVFAGLAAENALRWLKEKASAFFKTADDTSESGESENKPLKATQI